jgi:hypothetical protein
MPPATLTTTTVTNVIDAATVTVLTVPQGDRYQQTDR